MAHVGTSRKENESIGIAEVVYDVKELLGNLSSLSSECCIYEVPETLRKINEKAYTPLHVSIGPFHHGSGRLKAMENQKVRYLSDLLQRSGISLEVLIEFIKRKEHRIRLCYAENFNLSSTEFVKMVLLDASFIIGFLLRNLFPDMIDANDLILRKPWMTGAIDRDLQLLENQLPFFVLDDIFKLVLIDSRPDGRFVPNFIELTREYMRVAIVDWNDNIPESTDLLEVQHLIDCIRSCFKPRETRRINQEITHPIGYAEIKLRCATMLQKAGVKFMLSPKLNLFDGVAFKDGVLELPRVEITDKTECLLRNLVAFEQCHYEIRYMTDFVGFMSDLIDTPNDVNLLVNAGVIVNNLGKSQHVSNLFTELNKENLYSIDNFSYPEIYRDLNAYCTTYCTKWTETLNDWKASLRRDYFTTPWRVLSITVASTILVLTFIQAVCSIKQLRG